MKEDFDKWNHRNTLPTGAWQRLPAYDLSDTLFPA